jgi:hypothetical protein
MEGRLQPIQENRKVTETRRYAEKFDNPLFFSGCFSVSSVSLR